MNYVISSNEREGQVNMAGRLTFNDHTKVRALISEIKIKISTKPIVLNFYDLEFIDSAGVGMILIVNEELCYRDQSLVIRKATGQVKRVLEVAQMYKILTIED